ncbi:hypothetical protein [Vibrio phage VP16C]|nr:hypothetical protein [Vibrio phage VP16C]
MNEIEYKVDRETAEAEFDQMCDVMGVETDEDIMAKDDREDFAKHKERVIKSIMRGVVVLNDGVPTVHCSDGDKVTFKEPKGGAMIQPMKKNEDELNRIYKIAGTLTGGTAHLAKRHMRDYRPLLSLTSLFISM